MRSIASSSTGPEKSKAKVISPPSPFSSTVASSAPSRQAPRRPAEADTLAEFQLLGRPHQRPPAARIEPLDQHRLDAGRGLAALAKPVEPGGNDAGVVDDQRIAGPDQARQIGDGEVGERAGGGDMQQPRGFARARRGRARCARAAGRNRRDRRAWGLDAVAGRLPAPSFSNGISPHDLGAAERRRQTCLAEAFAMFASFLAWRMKQRGLCHPRSTCVRIARRRASLHLIVEASTYRSYSWRLVVRFRYVDRAVVMEDEPVFTVSFQRRNERLHRYIYCPFGSAPNLQLETSFSSGYAEHHVFDNLIASVSGSSTGQRCARYAPTVLVHQAQHCIGAQMTLLSSQQRTTAASPLAGLGRKCGADGFCGVRLVHKSRALGRFGALDDITSLGRLVAGPCLEIRHI